MAEHVVNRGYKFRVLPTEKQKEEIQKAFGAVRYTYNWALRRKQEQYSENKEAILAKELKPISKGDLIKEFQALKKTSGQQWLRKVDAKALNKAIDDVYIAYDNWFKRLKKGSSKGFPKFKSKRDNSYSLYLHNQAVRLVAADGGYVFHNRLSPLVQPGDFKDVKMLFSTFGPINVIWHRPLPVGSKVMSARLTKNHLGEYYVSFSLEIPTVSPVFAEPTSIKESDVLAFDLGLSHFLIMDDGTKVGNPRYLIRAQEKLAIEQRRLSRKIGSKKGEKKSQSWLDQKKKVGKVQAMIARQRKDFIHKLSAELVEKAVNEGKKVIAAEDLKVSGMVKNKRLSKSISDASWATFKTALAYKCDAAGLDFIAIPQWFPSSKLCSSCGAKKTDLVLSDRAWICQGCGSVHDRDINAATNIKRAAFVMKKYGVEKNDEVMKKVLDTYKELG